MFRTITALALVVGFCTSVHGQARPVYNKTVTVDKNVDSVRHVAEATVTNNARGDMMIDFMATRSDLPGTRERWTITFDEDPAFKLVQHVDINGVRRYTAKSAIVAGHNEFTLVTPGGEATVSVVCPALNFAAYAGLADDTAADRALVAQITSSVKAAILIPPSAPNPSYAQCVADCGPPPSPNCNPPSEPQDICDCINFDGCCRETVDWTACSQHCYCLWISGLGDDCLAEIPSIRQIGYADCFNQFNTCMGNVWG